jgi:hypothetical protein
VITSSCHAAVRTGLHVADSERHRQRVDAGGDPPVGGRRFVVATELILTKPLRLRCSAVVTTVVTRRRLPVWICGSRSVIVGRFRSGLDGWSMAVGCG